MPLLIPLIAGIAGLFGGSILNTAATAPTVVQETPEANLVKYAAYGLAGFLVWRVAKKYV
jgi:hypothetical protein